MFNFKNQGTHNHSPYYKYEKQEIFLISISNSSFSQVPKTLFIIQNFK